MLLAAVGLVALATRLAYLALLEREGLFFGLFLDSLHYANQAARIRQGHGIGAHPYLFSPLYPYVLSLFADAAAKLDVRVVQILQAVAGSATALLAVLVARRVAGLSAAAIAGFAVALHGPFVHGESQILVTALQTLFLTLSLWLFLGARDSWPRALGAGAALGVAAALHPTSLLVAVAAAGLLLAARRGREALWLLAGVGLLVLPFTIRNVARGGEWVLLSANAGINFWVGNAAGANGLYRLPPGTDFMNDPLSKHAAERESGRAMSYREASRHWAGEAAHDIRAAPLAWGALLGKKALYFLHPTEISQLGTSFDWYRDRAWPLRFPVGARAIFLLVLLLPLVKRGPPAWPTLAATIFLLTYAAAICLFFVTDRHRAPILPVAIVLASSAATGWIEQFRQRAWSRALLPLAAAALLALAGRLLYDMPGAPLHVATATGLEERHQGMALYEAGRYAEAVEAYRASLAIVDDPITRNNLANALVRAGRPEQAAAEYRLALERHPGSGLAWYNYGILLRSLDDRARAEEAFRNAIRHAPRMAEAHYRLGLLYLDTARPELAVEALTRALATAPPGSPLAAELQRSLERARGAVGAP